MKLTHLISSSVLGLSFLGGIAQAEVAVDIFHFADMHSRYQPINKYNSTCDDESLKEKKCFGGFPRFYQALEDQRTKAEDAGSIALTLVGGDQFQGSLFYTKYKGTAATELMNLLDLDGFALGNHEFDDGPEKLAPFITGANFPLVSANINAQNDPLLKDLIKPYTIVEKKGEKFGIIGLTAKDTDETSSPGEYLEFIDTVEAVRPIVAELEAKGINKIILVTHIGYGEDQRVAREVSGIDLIVGGHTNTLLSNTDENAKGPYPTLVKNPDGQEVPIVHAYAYGKYLGHLSVTFDDEGKVIRSSGAPLLLDASSPENEEINDKVNALFEPLAEIKNKVVAQSPIVLDGDRKNCRLKECILGNLITDSMLTATKGQGVTIALQNGGGIRASINDGPVTMGEILDVLPFQNTVATFELSGAEVIEALENGVSKVEEGAGRFPQVSGIRYTWDPLKEAGSRIVSVELKTEEGTFAPLDLEKRYLVVSNDYLRSGGDGYKVFKEKGLKAYDFGPNLEDVLSAYLFSVDFKTVQLEDRITTIGDLPAVQE